MLYLLDASALINSPNFEFRAENKYITTSLIFSELKEMSIKYIAENALAQGILKIQDPSEETIKKISENVSKHGFNKMSKQDLSLIALASEFYDSKKEFKVLTDDYSIQNFLKLLKIPYNSISQKGISRIISFSVKCRSCGKKFSPDTKNEICDVCGSELTRRQS
ncbi:MAG: hypothetical protein V1672_03885 [Candidatus Diapherotrites archaeon]